MSLNTEFYGEPVILTNDYPELKGAGLWIKGTSQANAYTFGAFVDNNPTGYDGVIAPLDESIIPWKIGKGSDAFKRATLIPGYNGTNYDLKVLQATQPHKGIEDGYRFLLTYNGDDNRQFWNVRHSPWTTKTDYINGAFPYERYCAPIVQFNYQNTIGTMYVLLYQKNSGSTGNYRYISLKDFLSNSTYSLENWYVTGFSYQIFVKSRSNSFRTYEKLQMVNFDEYVKHPEDFVNGNVYGENYHHYLQFIVNNTQESSGESTPANRPTIGGMYGQYTGERDSGAPMADRGKNFKDNYNFMCAATRSTYYYTLGGYDADLAETEFTPSVQWLINGYNYWQLLAIPKAYNSLGTKQAIYDYAMHQAAYMGFIFTIDSPTNDNDKYVPEINENGVTTGEYEPYPTTKLPNKTWTDDVLDNTPYNPEGDIPDPDPNTYDKDNKTILNDVIIRPEFCTRYALTSVQLRHAHSFLCTTIATDTDSEYWSSQKLYVNNPMDCIQNVMLFPFDISAFQTDEPSYKNLAFGQLVDDGYSVQVNREQYCTIDMGSCTYYPTFGNNVNDFRNYPPYSSATLYIPYCGSVEIDPNLYMGHTIGVKIIVDMSTGGCLALILRDSLVVDSISGTMGITVPITGIQTQTLAAAERQAESQLKTARNSAIKQFAKGVTSIAASTALGGVIGTVAMTAYQSQIGDVGLAKDTITKAQYNLEHINVPYKTIGTATSTTSFANERKCRLIVRRPVMLDYNDTDYAHTTGYACMKTGKVSDFTGYTEFQSVDLSDINATSTEKEMLYKLLQGGVFN
jgi:hypothetical protein